MNTSLLILLCGTFGQVFGGADQDEAQLDARGPSALIDAGGSDIRAGGTEDTGAEAPVSFSLNDVIHRLLQQQEEIRQLQVMVQSFRCESGVLTTNINSGSGWRYRDLTATFSRRFPRKPVVTVGLIKLDNSRDRNLRVNIEVQSVYVSHLIVRFNTWADTRLNSVGVKWMACA